MTRAAGAWRPALAAAAQQAEKRAAAERAAGLVRPGMIVGLGSGSTAGFVLGYLAARLGRGDLPEVAGIPAPRHPPRPAGGGGLTTDLIIATLAGVEHRSSHDKERDRAWNTSW